MKLCMIGCGRHARMVYVPSILRCKTEAPDLMLAACCDIDAESAKLAAAEAGFTRAYVDYNEMLDAEKPDAVLVITSYAVTAQVAADVMKKGYPVLIEKPPGSSIQQTEALAAQVAEAPCLHQVAFNRRHIPVIRALKQDVAARGAMMQHIDYGMYRIKRLDRAFYTTAVHGVDLVCHLAQSACVNANFTYNDLSRFGEDVRNFLVQLQFENGMTAHLTFCPVAGEVSETLKVTTDAGTYHVNTPIWSDKDESSLAFKERDVTTVIPASDGGELFESNGFWYQLHSFLQCVRDKRQPDDTLETCLDTMRLSDCIRRLAAAYKR